MSGAHYVITILTACSNTRHIKLKKVGVNFFRISIMKFWTFSTTALATLLSVVSLTQAGGPTDGEAAADPNSAVVQLTADNFKSFLDENPLVLAEFFAPWCGYCKMLGPELSKASDVLNESHPNIKLAQIDCVDHAELCQEHEIRGYPTLKVFSNGESADYEGGRQAENIVEYMIKQSLPAVQVPESVSDLETLIEEQTKPFVVYINPKANEKDTSLFDSAAKALRNDYTFISASSADLVKSLKKKFTNVSVAAKKNGLYVVHPGLLDDVREFTGDFSLDTIKNWIANEGLPYFGEINRDTYLHYMTSDLPLAYYFYKTEEQKEAVTDFFNKLGKQYRGKLNFVSLDANVFGRHAESINMDPEIVPLFAIQSISANKKYGINQTEFPEGPSQEAITKFVADFAAGSLKPTIKSEPLPTAEEQAASPVTKLVAHNYNEVLGDVSKDIFVKYYAPWCGHCKNLAPTWEELAEVYTGTDVVIAHIDHSNNDVETAVEIEGYPTLFFYPANGEIDEKTGLRKPVVFSGARDLTSFIEFIKEQGTHKVDGEAIREGKAAVEEDDEEETKGETKKEDEKVEHDEL